VLLYTDSIGAKRYRGPKGWLAAYIRQLQIIIFFIFRLVSDSGFAVTTGRAAKTGIVRVLDWYAILPEIKQLVRSYNLASFNGNGV
jgi:hypothetical protein